MKAALIILSPALLQGILHAQTAKVYTVGPNESFSTLSAAVAAASDDGGSSDIRVDAGTYTNDFPGTIPSNTTIEGVGGMAHFVATVPPPNGKGILDVSGNVTLRYLELSGATSADDNGAGVRYENGTLVMEDCFVHDNQDGLLANADPNGSITIDHSEFARDGNSEGNAHNIYVGSTGVGLFTLTNSYIHDAIVGHEVKTRATTSDIENNRIFDNAGTSSYSIDAPNGGTVTIKNNVVEQGPNGQNPFIFAFGEEGNLHPNTSLTVTGNTIVNDLDSSSAQGFLNPTSTTIKADQNSLYGISPAAFLASATNTTVLDARPALDTSSPIQLPGTGISTTSWFHIVNQNSGDCVDDIGERTQNGTSIAQWKCKLSGANQDWQFQPTDSGYYRLALRSAPSSVVDVKEYEGTGNGAQVQLWSSWNGPNQQWMPVALGGGLYKFVGRNSGRCLDVPGASLNAGVQLQIYDCNGTGAQAFRLVAQP